MSVPIDFRTLIDAERERRNLTVTALAEAATMQRTQLSAWLSGAKADINASTLARLLAALDLTIQRD